jgi:transposase
LCLTPGQAHDLTGVADLLDRIPTPRRLLADCAYDARQLRDWLAERGCKTAIPPNPTRKHPHSYDKHAYRGRNVVERSSVVSRIFAELQPVTTNAPMCSFPQFSS